MFRKRRKVMLKTKLNTSALELLRKHEQMLGDECSRHSQLLGTISQTLGDNWREKMIYEASFILQLTKGREALRKVISENDEVSGGQAAFRYQISSLFLRDCWKYLKSDPARNERIHLVTGTVTVDSTKVLSRMEKVKYDRQSSAYVSADGVESHQKMVSLAEDHGHLVLAVFHSHMSGGVAATAPSSVDMAFLGRMAKIGCDCLGGIFSLDGYTRFFMTSQNFEIEVYGKGVNEVQDNPSCKIFKIVEGKNHERKSI